MEGSGENAALSLETKKISSNNVDEIASSIFGFKFYSGSSSASGLPSLTISPGLNQNGQVNEIQDQRFPQSPAHSMTRYTSSHDAYNWRKYGLKLVKGSEFPRSYYKCPYPDCEVKRIFERSPSGQMTEILSKGSHDHPKPQSARQHTLVSIQDEKMDKDLSFTTRDVNEVGHDCSNSQTRGVNDEIDEDGLLSKRSRKMEDGLDSTPVIQPICEPRVVVQTMSEVDILEDGYRWRKYGQKVVRGNPNPRSYYKCTNAGCPVRKHVERASHDFKAVITTYEAKHNHDVPLAKKSTVSYNTKSSSIRPEQSSSLSLNLGVGISSFESGWCWN